MNRAIKNTLVIAAIIFSVAISAAAGYWLAQKKFDRQKFAANKETREVPSREAQPREILYWYDPMQPGQHFDKPGKSPFMDMQLVPRYADEDATRRADEDKRGGNPAHENANTGMASVRIDAATRQNLGIRLAAVERRAFDNTLNVAGTIGFNEREIAIVQARANGFVARVYARAPGDVIARGAPLADVLVPEWSAAQQEFIALRRSGDNALIAAARERLQLLGMPADVVQRVERSEKPQTTVTIAAPIAGVIQSLDVREGMTIAIGATLAQINSLRTVWLTASVPAAMGDEISVGDALRATVNSLDKELAIEGRVIAVLPQTDTASRTLSVRAELQNNGGRLRPGQYARVELHAATADALVIPSQALIRSGERTIAIVAEGDRFVPVPVRVGRESGDVVEIRDGLREGQHVVVSGQFLIDSEANLTGALNRMETTLDSNAASEHSHGEQP